MNKLGRNIAPKVLPAQIQDIKKVTPAIVKKATKNQQAADTYFAQMATDPTLPRFLNRENTRKASKLNIVI